MDDQQATIRDLQRALANCLRNGRSLRFFLNEQARQIARQAGIPLRTSWRSGRLQQDELAALQPVADRMAAQFGPTTRLADLISPLSEASPSPEAGEERKKGTDEVAPATTQTTNEKHGGDGASGEVPDGHSEHGNADSRQVGQLPSLESESESEVDQNKEGGTGDQSTQRGQGTADPRDRKHTEAEHERRGGAAETDGNATPQARTAAQMEQGPSSSQEQPTEKQQERRDGCEGENVSAEGTAAEDARSPRAPAESNVASTDRTSTQRADTSDAGEPDPAKQVGEDGDPSEKIAISKEGKASARKLAQVGKVSRQARAAHGGITALLRKAQIAPSLVSQVRSVLATWTEDGGQDEQGVRWDYARLAARLLTKRSPYPARKDELGRPILLVLADVSGSCAGFSEQSLLVARAIAAHGLPGRDVLVVSHSNGYPDACELNGRPLPALQLRRYKHIAERAGASYRSDGIPGNIAFYRAMIRDYMVSHVIALGDHDAVEVYTMLALSSEVQQVLWLDNYACNYHGPRRDTPNVSSPAARAKMRYVTGCKDASAFLHGLRVARGQVQSSAIKKRREEKRGNNQ